MPESFFLLTKDHLDIAIDEIVSLAKMHDRFSKITIIDNLVIVQAKTGWEKISRRATFVKISGKVMRKMSGLFLDEENFLLLKNTNTFACRIINLSSDPDDVNEIEKAMGNMISKFSQAKVSLEDPEIIVYAIFTGKENFFGISKKNTQSITPKKIKKHPHELDRRLTRAMINLIGIETGKTVCDPFCGTGTTLLEAESMGIRAIGIDFDEKMYQASKANLAINGYQSRLIKGDFSQLAKIIGDVDGIVTDIPYGRASKTSENPEDLLGRFVSMLPQKKKIAIMCKKEVGDRAKINPIKKYEIYRHKSLTRTILIK